MDVHACLFATPLGDCGLAWSAAGVVAVQLPESSPTATRARLLRHLPGATTAAPSAMARLAMDGIVALLGGAAVDLGDVMLDDARIAPFPRRVYDVARKILPGSTLTYGEVAVRVGEPGAARSVGQALGANPFAIIVPCHRVVAAGGAIGGFSAGGGAFTKRRLLAIERARVGTAPDLFADEPPGDDGRVRTAAGCRDFTSTAR